MIVLLYKNWQLVGGVIVLAIVIFLFKGWNHSEYLRGVADQKAANAELIRQSRELTDYEKNSAIGIGSNAARRVCIEQGADPRECDGL